MDPIHTLPQVHIPPAPGDSQFPRQLLRLLGSSLTIKLKLSTCAHTHALSSGQSSSSFTQVSKSHDAARDFFPPVSAFPCPQTIPHVRNSPQTVHLLPEWPRAQKPSGGAGPSPGRCRTMVSSFHYSSLTPLCPRPRMGKSLDPEEAGACLVLHTTQMARAGRAEASPDHLTSQ